jgi:predicted ABC-type ATPase
MPDNDPPSRETPYDTPAVRRLRAKQDKLPSTHTIQTRERQELRQQIAKRLYGSGAARKDREVWVVIGPPAAGKSSILVEPLASENGALVIDSDMAKEQLPEYAGGSFAGRVHEESGGIAGQVLEAAVANGDNIVLAIVGKTLGGLQEYIKHFHEAGYKVHLRPVHLPPEKAAARVVKRFEQTGRFVDPAYVLYDVGLHPSEQLLYTVCGR